MPERNEPPLNQMSCVELRRYTACGLVYRLCGHLAEDVRGTKDVTTKTLTIRIKWSGSSSASQRRLASNSAEELLRKWVWDGWKVSVVNARDSAMPYADKGRYSR